MLRAAGDGKMRAAQAARVRSHIVVLVLAVLVDVRWGGKKRRSAARHRPEYLFAFSLGDQRFSLFHDLFELGLLRCFRRIKLLGMGAGDNPTETRPLGGTLIAKRLDAAKTVTDEK